jgi:Tfp pilus assembly protein PilF
MNIPLKGFFCICLVFLLVGCGFKEARIKKEKESEASYKLGLAYLNDSNPNMQKALIEFAKSVEMNPKNKEARYALGHVYAQRQDYAKAISELQSAINIDPNYSEAHNYLGKCYEALGQYTEAISSYQMALKNIQYLTPQLPHWNMGMIYFKQKQYDKALEAFQQTRRIEPANGDVLAKIAETYIEKGETDNALSSFKEAVTLLPNDPIVHNRLALFYLEKGSRALAAEAFNKVISLAPDSIEAEAAKKHLEDPK